MEKDKRGGKEEPRRAKKVKLLVPKVEIDCEGTGNSVKVDDDDSGTSSLPDNSKQTTVDKSHGEWSPVSYLGDPAWACFQLGLVGRFHNNPPGDSRLMITGPSKVTCVLKASLSAKGLAEQIVVRNRDELASKDVFEDFQKFKYIIYMIDCDSSTFDLKEFLGHVTLLQSMILPVRKLDVLLCRYKNNPVPFLPSLDLFVDLTRRTQILYATLIYDDPGSLERNTITCASRFKRLALLE